MGKSRHPRAARPEKRFPKLWAFMAALLLGTLLYGAAPAFALTVQGLPHWLGEHVKRSLDAIWEEIPQHDENARFDTLSVVATRLFAGYRIRVERLSSGPVIVFEAGEATSWGIVVAPPDLREPVSFWFERDASGIEAEILPLLEGLPTEALSWADVALKAQVENLLKNRLPGWDFSLQARIQNTKGELHLAFRPASPLVLAVTPSIFSSTLPVMFQTDLAVKLVPGLSPLIGLPVPWVASHQKDVEVWARDFLEDRNSVSNTRSKVKVMFVPDQVSTIEATVNSDRLIFQIWLAAYAGIEGRYPEAGFLVGWNLKRNLGVELELYTEGLLELNDFATKLRIGGRLPLFKDFKVGGEVEWPSEAFWYRAWWDSNTLRRPYAWWRYRPNYGHNAAIGYRVNENIAIEIHYDGRHKDEVGLRGLFYF